MTTRRLARTAAFAAVVPLLLTFPGAAQAGGRTFVDPRGDTDGGPSGNDIVATAVQNAKQIGVVIHHRKLNKKALDIQFRIKAADGAETVAFGNFDTGEVTVYDGDLNPIACEGGKVARKIGRDTTRLSIPRSCVLGKASTIRVSARVQWSADGSKGDDSFNKSTYSPKVKR